jgi:uncharacterized protein
MTSTTPTTPLFPLQTVLFPGTLLPLRIFEARYLDMISASLRSARPFGIVPIRIGREVGATPDFFPFGTLASVESFDQGADGLLHVRVQGTERFRVESHEVQPDALLVANISVVTQAEEQAIPGDLDYLKTLLTEIFEANAEQIPYRDWQMDNALWVAYRLAEILPLAAATKVAVLQADSGLAALSRLAAGMQVSPSAPPRGTH